MLIRIQLPCRSVEAPAQEPASRELIVARNVITERSATRDGMVIAIPHHFGAADEGMIKPAAQRLPPQRRVESVELVDQRLFKFGMTTRVRYAEINIVGLGQ